jgi:hypothetical protein
MKLTRKPGLIPSLAGSGIPLYPAEDVDSDDLLFMGYRCYTPWVGRPGGTSYQSEDWIMAMYTCPKCGMSVGMITCGHCGKELVHDQLSRPDGSAVLIAKCPDGHGKIKSPMCCGQDMSCAIA